MRCFDSNGFRVTVADDTFDATFFHVVENSYVSRIEIFRVDDGIDASGH